MYIQVFTIGEMRNDEGEIEPGFLNGETTNDNSKIHFHKVRKPPKSAWNEWKSFLYRTFISGNNKISPALENKVNIVTQSEDREIDSENLISSLHQLPEQIRELISNITLPTDNGEALIEELTTNGLLGASNGSLIEHTGSGG